MAPRRCCVPSCTVIQGDGTPMHSFPNPNNLCKPDELERFRTWVMRIGGDIVGEEDWFIYQNRKVCHRHFEEIFTFPNKRLTRSAIPSLHIPGLLNLSQGQVPALGAPTPSMSSASAAPPASACGLLNLSQGQVPALGAPTPSMSSASAAPPASACGLLSLSQGKVPVLGAPTPSLSSASAAPPASACGLQSPSQGQVPVFEGISYDASVPSTSSASIPVTRANLVCGTRPRVPSKRMTKVERELRDTLRLTKNTLAKCKKSKNILKTKLILANKIMKTSAFEIVSKKMTPAAKTFFQMQISQFGKRPRGLRFSLDEKILALSVYKPCPKAYKLLSKICILPKRRTLDKLLQKVNLLPGINDILFYHLKKRVDKMPNHHKLCTIIFDEMAIAPHVSFDERKDEMNGFVDNGVQRTNTFCDHVLVFMVRGIIKKFKQPVAFTFCSGTTKTTELKTLIKDMIKKVTATGLHVVSTVCDQGATNMAAVNALINDTKSEYMRQNKNYKGGFFEVENSKIYAIYDPPHLIKGIRNNMLNKDLEYQMDGRTRRAKWGHLEALYRRGPGYKGVRLINKITAQHVLPNLIPKMRVKYCTQVFSQNVGVTMGYMAGVGDLPKESVDTADILLFFDKLFDSVNGSFSKPIGEKIYRSAVTPRSPHHKLWHKSLPILKSMKFVTPRGTKSVVPSIASWIKTIEAFQEVTKYLHSLGLNSLLLRHFNQDPIENFFGAIRAHGLRNVMPSASAFMASYKALLIGNLTSPHSVGSNCEEDGSKCLQSLKFFLTENIAKPVREEMCIDEHHLNIELVDTQTLIKTRSATAKEKCAAIAYCSGWLVQLLKKRIFKNCETCKTDLESESIQEFHSYIKMKEYQKDKTWLSYPSWAMFDFFCQLENVTVEILKTSCHSKTIAEYIELVATININLNFVRCTDHKEQVAKFVFRRSIVFFLNNWCREINQILSGNTTFWDEDDCMKQKANNYCLKHKKRGQNK